MPSLISQMRSAQAQPQQQSNAVAQVRNMMNVVRSSRNPQQALMQLVQGNPQLSQAMQSGNLQAVAQQMAMERGIDLGELVRELGG